MPQKIEAHRFQNEKVTAVWSGWTHLVAQTGKRAAENLWSVRVAVLDSCLNSYECSGLSRLVFTDEKLLGLGRGDTKNLVLQSARYVTFAPWTTGLHPKKQGWIRLLPSLVLRVYEVLRRNPLQQASPRNLCRLLGCLPCHS